MQAPVVRRPGIVANPSLGAGLRAIVAVQLVALTAGAALALGGVSGPPGSGGGGPGGDPGTTPSHRPSASPSPSVPSSPSPSSPPSGSPTPAPTATPHSTPVPTRPAQPVPTVTPGTVEPPPPAPATPPPNPGGGPPTCAYLDVPTRHDDLDDWDRTLLDTIYRLPSGYAPGDLVDTSAAGLNGGYAVRGFVVADLRAMAAAARQAGAPIAVVSGYRSYAKQKSTFQHWVDVGGYEQALRTSARPGHSEHQLGTVVDVTSRGGRAPWEYRDWATTEAGAWIAGNSWRYGFVVSYPKGAFDRTCYSYEPWHLRYVGRERAAQIRASGLTPREVIWRLQ